MPSTKPRIVFLYTELAGYIRACMEQLAAAGAEVHVFAFPVNAEAPFDFDTADALCRYLPRRDYDLAALRDEVARIDPDLVVCSGWIDPDYVALCRSLRPKVRTVLALDNQYPATLRGKLALLRAKVRFKSAFDFAWVPGSPQVAYAEAMGFRKDKIFTGFYTADTDHFSRFYKARPQGSFAKRFLYFGRYVDFKGVRELWEAFGRLDAPDWELWCAGTGALFDERPEMPGLRHFGFVQPADLDTFVAEGGVFVLPSTREPWGVAVHEFAAAGLPLICTNVTGAASAFLEDGKNGILVPPADVGALYSAMKTMTEKPISELESMGKLSAEAAAELSKEKWAETAFDILKTSKP